MLNFAVLLVAGVIVGQAHADAPEAIVGGNDAMPGQFPHQVSLQWGGAHHCGGSIISPTHILTAAHCIPDTTDYTPMDIITGSLNSRRVDGEFHKVKCVHKHEKYTGNLHTDGLENDIALITLEKPIEFNKNQNLIPLATENYATADYTGLVSGWGRTDLKSGVPHQLQWIETNVLSEKTCLSSHPKNTRGISFTNPNQLCTLKKRGQGACSGDSGGPLVVEDKLAGIGSWVLPCAVGYPDVYTKVSEYLDWIKDAKTKC